MMADDIAHTILEAIQLLLVCCFFVYFFLGGGCLFVFDGLFVAVVVVWVGGFFQFKVKNEVFRSYCIKLV